MPKNIALFDLQFLKYTHLHTAYPSTAGVLLAGYHKAKKDNVVLATKPPNFSLYDIVYVINDDWDIYYLPEWIRHPNAILVGRFWEKGLAVWQTEWESYPPDMTPYRKWATSWLKKYPYVKEKRFEHFFYDPVLIKTKEKIKNPEGHELLILDYEPHKIDAGFETLRNLNVEKMRTLHPVNISYEPELALEFVMQKNMMKSLWITIDLDLPEKELANILAIYKELKPPRTVRIKVWLKGANEEEWQNNIKFIIPYLARWREEAKKRIFVEPVDEFTAECPDLLHFLRRWTGRDMGYSYNSLFDYAIYEAFKTEHLITRFLEYPYETIKEMKKFKNNDMTKAERLENILNYILKYPEIGQLITKPVNGKGW